MFLDVAVERRPAPEFGAHREHHGHAGAWVMRSPSPCLDARGFGEEDYAMHHPGGSLGRRLLMHVSDVMVSGDRIPKVSDDAPLAAAIMEMSKKGWA